MSQIDREAVQRVQVDLKKQQDERLKLEEEVIFLRGLVSSKSGGGGLHIRRFSLQHGKSKSRFRYNFTVSKVVRGSNYTPGYIFLSVTGKQGVKARTMNLKSLSDGSKEKVKMRFRHCPNVEGEFILPKGFKPSRVNIEVKPDGKKFKPVKKSFNWIVS